jgi:hypothetical protein
MTKNNVFYSAKQISGIHMYSKCLHVIRSMYGTNESIEFREKESSVLLFDQRQDATEEKKFFSL